MTKEDIFAQKEILFDIARFASAEIMRVYNATDFIEKIVKDDGSPLTLADKLSNDWVVSQLAKNWANIPILSEEEAQISFETRKNWDLFWSVDPLDGTKEFISRNGEFAICIALVQKNEAVVGLIAAPVTGEIYFGVKGIGAFKVSQNNDLIPIFCAQKKQDLIALGSRTHGSEADAKFLAQYPITSFIAKGSALKFCALADGSADFYYRSGPTMEWDTAAGQAILEAAGGRLTKIDGSDFRYNKENLRNEGFICQGF